MFPLNIDSGFNTHKSLLFWVEEQVLFSKHSEHKLQYMPEVLNDDVFSSLCEGNMVLFFASEISEWDFVACVWHRVPGMAPHGSVSVSHGDLLS